MIRAAALCLLLSGCWWDSFTVRPPKPDPFDVHEDMRCEAPCDEAAAPITASPDSAIVSATLEHALRKACETRRRACAEALNRARDARAIK